MNTQNLRNTIIQVVAAAIVAFGPAGLVGCDKGPQEETRTFEEAEALYRAGDYDGATLRYEAFLEAYPRSPFAKTARMRLSTIEREVESVMGAGGANRPVFIRPSPADSRAIIEEALGDAGQDAGALPPSQPDDDLEGRAGATDAGR